MTTRSTKKDRPATRRTQSAEGGRGSLATANRERAHIGLKGTRQTFECLGYLVEIRRAEEGGYNVRCPTLRVATQGETLLEALAAAEEAVTGMLEVLEDERIPVPPKDVVPSQ